MEKVPQFLIIAEQYLVKLKKLFITFKLGKFYYLLC